MNGDYSYFLDSNGQLRKAKKLEGQIIQSLFGKFISALCYNFPIWENTADKGELPIWRRKDNRFDQMSASMAMYQAASEQGPFNPDNAVRGVGAWADDDGDLIYHLGNKILYRGHELPPGRIEGKIYPAAHRLPPPDFSGKGPDPVPEILNTLESWNWARPDLHPFVSLGMIGVQMLCGALDWRPTFWLTAAAGAGKSEFQKFIKILHGEGGILHSTDATKSGLTSQLGHASIPVTLDELEPGDERSTKEKDIIALARVASSGGTWFRGSADQSGVGGKVYSAFLFSSILIPGVMKTQDVQRLIRLDLSPLDKGTPPLNLRPRTWRERGERLKGILIQRWPTWEARLGQWRAALELADVGGRDADNWAPVLAMAEMAMTPDAFADEERASWARKVSFEVAANKSDTNTDAEAMLLHLLSQLVDPFRRGEQYTIGQWLQAAAGYPAAPKGLVQSISGEDDGYTDARTNRQKKANSILARMGLRVYVEETQAYLFIANTPMQGLKKLFEGSDWAGGAWSQSAARVPGAEKLSHPATLAGTRTRGVRMPFRSILGLSGLPMDQDSGSAAPEDRSDIEDYV